MHRHRLAGEAGGGQTAVISALALLFAYLFLVALYESRTSAAPLPLTTTVGLARAMLGILVAGLDNNVYALIDTVVLSALAAKNGIPITAFVNLRREEGMPIGDAAFAGAPERFHASMMTSFAFIAGLIPLLFTSAAEILIPRGVGTALFAGMIAASGIGIVFMPTLFVEIPWLCEKIGGEGAARPRGAAA